MVRIELSDTECQLLIDFLDQLGDRFSTDGCNDMMMENNPENYAFVKAAEKWNYNDEEEMEPHIYQNQILTSNGLICGFLKDKIEQFQAMAPVINNAAANELVKKLKTYFLENYPIDNPSLGISIDFIARHFNVRNDIAKKALDNMCSMGLLAYPCECCADLGVPTEDFYNGIVNYQAKRGDLA